MLVQKWRGEPVNRMGVCVNPIEGTIHVQFKKKTEGGGGDVAKGRNFTRGDN